MVAFRQLVQFSRSQRSDAATSDEAQNSSLVEADSSPSADPSYAASSFEDLSRVHYGRVEKFDGKRMSGWYFNMKKTTGELKVLFDGQVLCGSIADLSRQDVSAAFPGAPEYCGFFFDLTNNAILDQVFDLADLHSRLSVVDVDGIKLRHVYSDPFAQRARATSNETREFKGSFDSWEAGTIDGWAFSSHGSEVIVAVWVDGLLQGSVATGIRRDDIEKAFGKSGAGFSYPLSRHHRDGRRHTLRCTFADTGLDLAGSPKEVLIAEETEENAKRIEVLVNAFGELQRQMAALRQQISGNAAVSLSYLANYRFYRDIVTGGAATITRLRRKEIGSEAPLFSIVMPTYKSDITVLSKAIDSVAAQTDGRWELVISDSESGPALRDYLKERAAADPRIRVLLNTGRLGISDNTNAALREARGAYIGFMDHDDELAPEAVSLNRAAFETGRYDVVYSDEDKIDSDGNFIDPHYKPAFNLDLLLSMNYMCHLVFIRREVLFSTELCRNAFDGAQDWDLLLQLMRRVDHARVGHIPRVLYHWRMVPGSTAAAISEKSYAVGAGLRAVKNYLTASAADADATLLANLPYVDVKWHPAPGSKVSLIIPTKDRIDLVTNCINSILATIGATEIEILIVDNNSAPSSHAAFRDLAKDERIQVMRFEGAFNYSGINNFAARHASGEFLLLMNNDVFFTRPGWLEQMLGVARRPQVGAVGIKLLYPDNTIQHCGVVLGNGGIAGHAFTRLPPEETGYFARASCTQEVTAVTAACLLVRKEIYWKVGGLDEKELKIAFNDVDFCIKVQQAGFHNILVANKFAYHAESISRGHEDTLEKIARFNGEIDVMRRRWGLKLKNDRYYNPNFDLNHACYRVIDLAAIADQEVRMIDQPIVR